MKHAVHYSKKEYAEYLETDEWKFLRNSVISKSGFQCAFCITGKATQVHHMTYRNIVDVRQSDLRAVCNSCHVKIHAIVKRGHLRLDSDKHGDVLFRKTVKALERSYSSARPKLVIDAAMADKIVYSQNPRRIGGLLKVTVQKASDIEGIRVTPHVMGKIRALLERPILPKKRYGTPAAIPKSMHY